MNTTMQPAVMPGAACGITMVRRMEKPPAPRSYAASIRELSRLSRLDTSGTTMNSSDVYTKPTMMVASRYSSSTGTAVKPNFTSRVGSTPDSLSSIIQPSVRTVSLTQKGIRQMMNNSEPARPRASLAMIQAMGNASSSVIRVAITDMTAVRTNTCQYRGSAKKVLYCARLAAYALGPVRSRKDSTARSTCGNMISEPSHSRAGASNRPSARRACQDVSVADLSILARRPGSRRKAHRPGGIETEQYFLLGLEVGKLAGLGQRDAEFPASPHLLEQHRGIRPVEQHALHFALVPRMIRRQSLRIAREDGDFRTHECFNRVAHADRARTECADTPAVSGCDVE